MTAGRGQYDVHTDAYTGAFSVRSMKRVIDRLEYPGVDFYPYQAPDGAKKKRMKKKDGESHEVYSLGFLFA